MKKRFESSYLNIAVIIIVCNIIMMKDIYAQRNAGIFYSTIFAITDSYKRLSGWGAHAEHFFLKDVNGDGKDDAVIYSDKGKWSVAFSDGTRFNNPVAMLIQDFTLENFKPLMGDVNGDKKQDAVLYDPLTGNWLIALSEGTSFNVPVQWTGGGVPGTNKQFLADVNGDGMDDAVIYFDKASDGCWYVGLSNPVGRFDGFVPWISGFGNKYDEHFLADVNGDGKADAVIMERTTGFWKVAVSDGSCFTDAGVWKTGFGIANDTAFVYDIDRDGKSDIVYYKEADWWVSYSNGRDFDKNYDHLWVAANRPATMVSRSNLPAPQAKMIGNISGNAAGACAVSAGDWLILENKDKSKTVVAYEKDTWDAWGNPYTPQLPGFSSKYDAGDEWVSDQQIKLMHDAGFTYIMLDITNGSNEWVDSRAKKLIERIVYWNKNLSGSKRKMFFCISMGSSRTMAHQPASERVELESKRTWDEFYEPYQDAYYQMKGKPLLIHFVEYPPNRDGIMQYAGQMPYYQKFTIRWMFNEIKNQPEYVNAYGWPILGRSDNPAGDEVMNVSPGFWNGLTFAHRENGELYRRQWLRVLEYNPASIWLNSFNESWEHTSVEPAFLNPKVAAERPDILSVWTDYYGERMDDFYWVMTKQYNRLFMFNELFLNSYLQEVQSEEIYQVQKNFFKKTGKVKPHMAPVLLVPENFIKNFRGNIIDENLSVKGKILSSQTYFH